MTLHQNDESLPTSEAELWEWLPAFVIQIRRDRLHFDGTRDDGSRDDVMTGVRGLMKDHMESKCYSPDQAASIHEMYKYHGRLRGIRAQELRDAIRKSDVDSLEARKTLLRAASLIESGDSKYLAPDMINDALATMMAPPRTAEAEPPAEGGADSSPTAKQPGGPSGGKMTVNKRMFAIMGTNSECLGWTCNQWATQLGCTAPSVVKTKAWESLKVAKAAARMEHLESKRGTRSRKGRA